MCISLVVLCESTARQRDCKAQKLHSVRCMWEQREGELEAERCFPENKAYKSSEVIWQETILWSLLQPVISPKLFHYVLEQHCELSIIIRTGPLMENKIYECLKRRF